VISCVTFANGSDTRIDAGAREPTVTRALVGWNPSNVTRTSYRPGGTPSNRNIQAASVVVSCSVVVAVLSTHLCVGQHGTGRIDRQTRDRLRRDRPRLRGRARAGCQQQCGNEEDAAT
jgi:hypothetical protein